MEIPNKNVPKFSRSHLRRSPTRISVEYVFEHYFQHFEVKTPKFSARAFGARKQGCFLVGMRAKNVRFSVGDVCNTFFNHREALWGLFGGRKRSLAASSHAPKTARTSSGVPKDPVMAPGVKKMCHIHIFLRRFRICCLNTPRVSESRVTGADA